jgi:antitoxin component YwqK of YwqJK toxin-antitoxin module
MEYEVINTKIQYFENIQLLENTLLPYFSTEEDLKFINKRFYVLNYKKYNTYIQPHGFVETYYKDTKTIKTRLTYKNGELNGLWEVWWEPTDIKLSIQLFQRISFKNGKEDGLLEQWDSDGKFVVVNNYKNGNLRLSELYHRNGKLWVKSNYGDDEKDGLHQQWHENGQLHIKVNYKNGKEDGLYEKWDEDGKLLEIINYINGEVIE